MDTANEVIWFDPWGDCRHIWPSVNKFAGGHLPAQSLADSRTSEEMDRILKIEHVQVLLPKVGLKPPYIQYFCFKIYEPL